MIRLFLLCTVFVTELPRRVFVDPEGSGVRPLSVEPIVGEKSVDGCPVVETSGCRTYNRKEVFEGSGVVPSLMVS